MELNREERVFLGDRGSCLRLTSRGDFVPGLCHRLLDDGKEAVQGEPPLRFRVDRGVEALSPIVGPHTPPTHTPEVRREARAGWLLALWSPDISPADGAGEPVEGVLELHRRFVPPSGDDEVQHLRIDDLLWQERHHEASLCFWASWTTGDD